MSDTWAVDYLTVSRHDEPPAETVVIRALASAGFGTAEYTPATPPSAGAPATGRRRLGTYALQEPGERATGRIVVARHDEPVLTGMGETAFNALTRGLGADDVRTLREGRLALDLSVAVKNPADGVFLAWATRVLLVLLGFTEGAGIDPASQRCYGRVELAQLAAAISPLPHVAVHAEPGAADTYWLHTHGMQKFARPELDLQEVPLAYEAEGRALLADLTDSLARGARLSAGQEVDLDDLGRVVAVSVTPDEDHQAPYGRLRLVDAPSPGERPGETANRLLGRTVLADATRRADRGDVAGAFDTVERALAVDPDNNIAHSIKARLHLRAGQIMEALNIGELMELRAPADYRGPLIVGHALAALGRAREAELAYTRAIERNPDDGEAFAARAAAFDRLGQAREAAADRSRAAYLRA